MRLVLHPKTPEARLVRKVLDIFGKGGVVVYPTDSGYAIGCDALNKAAVHKLYHLKRQVKKYFMALMVRDFSVVAGFAKVDNAAYRYMKKLAPGPYTFILPATARGRKILDVRRSEIGIRMPDCPFGDALFKLKPDFILLTTAARVHEDESFSDPGMIDETFGHEVDMLVDMGSVPVNPTTVISLISGEPEVLRMGQGAML